VQKITGVQAVEGRRVLDVRARRGNDIWKNLTLVGRSDFTTEINLLIPLQGTQFPAKSEVLVSQNMIFITGFQLGEIIELELPDGSKHPVRVAGLVTDQTTSMPEPNSTNNLFISMKTLGDFGLDSDFNQLYITVTGDGNNPAHIAEVAMRVKEHIKNSQRSVYRMDEKLTSEHPMTGSILAIIGVLGALGGLITILSSSLIINTLNALLAQQLHQIGIMKLVGARSHQILGMYLVLIIAYGLFALSLAVPLGALAGYTLAWFIANMMGAGLQGFRFIPAAIVTQSLIAILVPLITGFFPVNSGVKISVQRAISSYRPSDQPAQRNLSNTKAAWFRWVSRPLLLSLRNTFRKRGRLLLTIFTLTVAGAVFIAVFNVRDSMSNVTNQLMEHFMGDVTINFRQPYNTGKVTRALLEIPGVAGVEGWSGAAGEIWDRNDDLVTRLTIAGPPQDTRLLHPDFVAGRWLNPNEKKALVISDTIYNFYPVLKPGDKLMIKIAGRSNEEWQVVGIFRFTKMLGAPLAYANFDFLADRTHLPDQAASFRIMIAAHDSASQQMLSRDIDEYLRDRNFLVQSVQSGYVLRATATQSVNILVIFLLIMAILTAFVGSIGLTGTMSINVLERTREIGVMRTIGAVDLVIMQSVIIEGLVIGLITWILAIGLSFPISYLLLTIVGEAMMGSAMSLSFTPLGILIWLAVVIILSGVASILPARNAARLTINEVLAYE
jgi:putative ABC transport system permease protein